MKLFDHVKDLLKPLPDPEKAYMKYWCQLYRFVSGSQIKPIVSMIIAEFQNSREIGLFLNPKELDTEISFWLDAINELGGTETILKTYDSTTAKEKFVGFRTSRLSKEIEFYQNLLAESKTPPPNAYLSHLERVETRMINAIFNNELTYVHPKPPV